MWTRTYPPRIGGNQGHDHGSTESQASSGPEGQQAGIGKAAQGERHQEGRPFCKAGSDTHHHVYSSLALRPLPARFVRVPLTAGEGSHDPSGGISVPVACDTLVYQGLKTVQLFRSQDQVL
jgi:hypothetical protein